MTTKSESNSEPSLVRQTLRTVALLVGACVIFVGALSVVAVAVTSRALGASTSEARTTGDGEQGKNAKKPLSI